MAQPPLTPRLAAKLASLFAREDQLSAEQHLLSECGYDLPGGFADPLWLERVRAAALKISGGSLDTLARATSLARRDWRDVLMGADFGNLNAHEVWLESPTSKSNAT